MLSLVSVNMLTGFVSVVDWGVMNWGVVDLLVLVLGVMGFLVVSSGLVVDRHVVGSLKDGFVVNDGLVMSGRLVMG